MRDTRDPSNTLESPARMPASRPRRGWVQAVLLACAAGRCRAVGLRRTGRESRDRDAAQRKRGARAGPGRPGERRSGQGRAGRHRVHAPGRGPASADGDQPRPGRRRRRPRQAGPRALCDGGPLFHRRRFRRGRAGAAGLRRHRRSRPGKQRPLRRPALYAHVQPCRERDRAGDRGDGAAAGRGSGQRGGAGPVGGRRLDRGAGGGRAGRRARRHQFRGRFGRGSGQIAGKPAGPSACRKPMPATLRPPACPCSGSIPRTTCTGGRNGRNAGPRPTTPPAAMRNSNAWGRTATTAIRCSRMRPRNGSRWCATSACAGLRHAGAGRGIRPGAPSLNVNADGSASIRPPRRVRPRRRWRAAPGR